ncbi:rod shape-determining protein RodA [Desulfurispirillum indicum S5]|uniref:Peptidoglycan glycosyltransferase RodA n=1 Tax=Desulfurispirillum indicum (strain ATCC BAA-1389 / DSM 22839 / S5) TaxID=653733 RepID=E6W261_DESIS|nr:rod shape-determining protein RodA [Desulfurispirillum indicum]ADU65519.1 rod shape-determining protein RodA [Desulfurispirillum indicum S5]
MYLNGQQSIGKRQQFFIEFFGRLDWLLIFFTLSLCAYGILMIYTSSYDALNQQPSAMFYKQLTWICIGIVVMFVMAFVDYHFLVRYAYIWYLILLLILLYVLIHGSVGMGAQRWIRIGGIGIQPSEIGKLVIVFTMAKYFSDLRKVGNLALFDLWKPFALVLIPFLMIANQPDLGTSLMFIMLFAIMVFVAGINLKLLSAVFVFTLASLPVLWSAMKPYQKRRVLTFLNPESDPHGAGYHIIQSKIAIGSGGIWGKGLLEGTQSQLRFLPERHTDFIGSVMAEELGMVGMLIFFALFFLLILRAFEIAQSSKDREGTFLAVGIISILVLHAFVNLGMIMGLLPVVGVPLPFISYGGSSMVAVLAGIGILLNIRIRRLRLNAESEKSLLI